MSRLGKKPVLINKDVKVEVEASVLTVKGPKGMLEMPFDSIISFTIDETQVFVSRPDDKKKSKELQGLYRALLSNMVEGVTNEFTKDLELHGIGYRVQQKGNSLEFSLGYSHPVVFDLPEIVTAKVDGQTKFSLASIDKEALGETCAKIRKLRRKDAYKGKGIHYAGEVIRKKAGKSVKK